MAFVCHSHCGSRALTVTALCTRNGVRSKATKCCTPQQNGARQCGRGAWMRRRLLLGVTGGVLAPWGILTPSSSADVLKDFARRFIRPDIDFSTALVMMLDARGVLLELRNVAAEPEDSRQRISINALLPGVAKRLRDVAQAAPALAAYLFSAEKDETLSDAYGGSGAVESGSGLVDPIFRGVGKVLTASGRGIGKDALMTTAPTEEAIAAINSLLDKVPQQQMDAAQQFRKSRLQS